jgi:hypothetical protein
MSGTFSGYPEQLDILERFADGVGYPSATAINILADAARQIQVAISADPIDANLPAGTASDWASLTTIQTWLERFFRFEVGRFSIDLPLESTTSTLETDVTIAYRHPTRFDHKFSGAGNLIPHFIGVTFDQPEGTNKETVQGGISYAPLGHVNRYYNPSTGQILGFTLRNNDPWSDVTYKDETATGTYWAFEPEYH